MTILLMALVMALASDVGSPSLEQCVCDAVAEHVRANGEEASVQSIRYPSAAMINSGVSFRAVPFTTAHVGGPITVMVDVMEKEIVARRIPVSCVVRTYGNALVAARRIDRHSPIDSADVSVQRVETTRLAGTYFRSLAALRGLRARRIINAGSVLCQNVCEPEPLVYNGDLVTLVTRNGGVKLSLPAVALEDGVQGGIIRVQPTGSPMKVRSQILSAQVVELRAE